MDGREDNASFNAKVTSTRNQKRAPVFGCESERHECKDQQVADNSGCCI